MSDKHNGQSALIQGLQHGHDLQARATIQVASRLVCQQERWVVDQSAGNGNPLLLATGKLRRHVMSTRSQTDQFERLASAAELLLARVSGVQQWQHNVLERGCTWEQIEALKDETDAPVAYIGQFVGRHSADSFAREPILAARRTIQAANEVHERGLTGTGRSHDSHKLAWIDL